MRVADFHTYFVGCQEWDLSVWAHNSYGDPKKENTLNRRLLRAELPEEVQKRIQMYGKHSYVDGDTGNAWSDHWTPARIRALKARATVAEMLADVDGAAGTVRAPGVGKETLRRQIEIEITKRGKPWGDPERDGRPAYAVGQEEAVWNAAAAKHPEGRVFHPNTDVELFWNDRTGSRFEQWHMGHRDGHKYEVWHRKYLDGELTLDQFLAWYRNPAHYQPESPQINMQNNQRAGK